MSFTALAKQTGLDPSTISAVFSQEAPKSQNIWPNAIVPALAVEPIELVGQRRPVLYNVRSGKLLDVQSDTDSLILGFSFGSNQKLRCTKLITAPMSEYRSLLQHIEYDHVVIGRQALLEFYQYSVRDKLLALLKTTDRQTSDGRIFFRNTPTLRRVAKRRVEAWADNFPPVAEAHAIYSGFFKAWGPDLRIVGRQKTFDSWRDALSRCDLDVRDIFSPVCATVEALWSEIFGFYEDPLIISPAAASATGEM